MAPEQCGFPGNSDLYGLGIRIGVYTQLLSTLITNHFVPSAVAGNSTANLIFLWALILAVIRAISENEVFFAVECFIILQLILMFFFASTDGRLFVVAECFLAFLDGHIPATLMKQILSKHTGWGKHISQYLSKLGQVYTDRTPLRVSFQRSLNLVASILSFWFWVSGIRGLRQVAGGCPTFVFLFGPVVVKTPIRATFILLSAVYLVHHSLRFLLHWWPDVTWQDWLQSNFDPRSKSERKLQDTAAKPLKKVFERARQTKRSALCARLLLYLHASLLTWSICVMCYFMLAVELTLICNNVRGIYEVRSTGQFIPLLIGVLGLGRALVSAFIERSGPPRRSEVDKSTIKRQEGAAKFQYCIGRRNKIAFNARPPSRRHSLSGLNTSQPAPKVQKVGAADHLAPVLPILPSQEKYLLDAPRVQWWSARFVFTDRGGGSHVFHDKIPYLKRRRSWSGATVVQSGSEAPHRARQSLWVPLEVRNEAQATESRREAWYESKKRSLRRHQGHFDDGWDRFCTRADNGHPNYRNEYRRPRWLPPDVTNETIFLSRPHRSRRSSWSSSTQASDTPSTAASQSPAQIPLAEASIMQSTTSPLPVDRRSFYNPWQGLTHGGAAPSVQIDNPRRYDTVSILSERAGRDSVYIADSLCSTEARSDFRRDSSRSSDIEAERPGAQRPARASSGRWSLVKKIRDSILCWIVTIFKALCLCGICVGCLKGTRELKRAGQNIIFERDVQQQGRTAPTLQASMLYQCATCDQDFEQERRTRQWHKINQDPVRTWPMSFFDRFKHLTAGPMNFLRPGYTRKVITALENAYEGLLYKYIDANGELSRAISYRVAAYEIEMEESVSDAGREPGSMA